MEKIKGFRTNPWELDETSKEKKKAHTQKFLHIIFLDSDLLKLTIATECDPVNINKHIYTYTYTYIIYMRHIYIHILFIWGTHDLYETQVHVYISI